MRIREPKSAPRQTRISVQDIPDYTTAEGAASANEEMRRLAITIAELQERADTPEAVAAVDVPGDLGDTTTIINNKVTTADGTTFICGIVTLHNYPSVSALEEFAREGADYSPATGRYGRPVFGAIEHGLDLTNPNAYVLELTDLQEVSGGLHKTPQIFQPQTYGLDGNRILVWAVLKSQIELFDGALRGAPQFFFFLGANACKDITPDPPPGLVLPGADLRRWSAQLDDTGTLLLTTTTSGLPREVILAGTGNSRWRMEIGMDGSLALRRMPAFTPFTIVRITLGTGTALLSVDADGNLVVTRE